MSKKLTMMLTLLSLGAALTGSHTAAAGERDGNIDAPVIPVPELVQPEEQGPAPGPLSPVLGFPAAAAAFAVVVAASEVVHHHGIGMSGGGKVNVSSAAGDLAFDM